jgi:hypothetical protein
MKKQEIKKGVNVTKGYCGGSHGLTCAPVCDFGTTCEKPSNLTSCAEPSNLKTKGVKGGTKCCGGGTLQGETAVSGTPCGASGISLCNQAGETLK